MADKLTKKRSSMKAKLTNFGNYLDNFENISSLSKMQHIELESRFAKFDALYSDFDELQTEIEILSDSTVDAYSARAQFEEQYYALVSRARILLAGKGEERHDSAGFVAGSEDSITGRHNNNFIRLPKIDLPHFDGGYQSWLEFRDTYLSLIHDNDSIDTISKFHYLRASLKGSAAQIIKNIIFKKDNYNIAWGLIYDRFNNNRLLVNFHVQALFNIEPVQKESSCSLRNLIDVTNKNLRALKMMNEPTEHWDTLILHMISTKLDPITFRDWEEYRNTLAIAPTLLQFCTFVSNKADLLETLEEQTKQNTNYKSKSFLISNNEHDQNKSRYQSNQSTIKCPLCSKSHYLYTCELFKRLSIEARIKKVHELNLCKNCLRPGHVDKRCKLAHCKYCKIKHNTLLHLDKSQPLYVNPMPGPSENVALSSTTSSLIKQSTTRSILLSTALVRVVSTNGEKYEARMLLDNGSTANFITDSLCEKLGLSRCNASSTVTGINNQISNSRQSCYLNFESINSDYSSQICCLILPVITKKLPPTSVCIDHLPIPSGIQLADPTFNIASAIDILVGAEIFWEVVERNHINLGKKQPILCESKLGWIVSGSLSVRSHSAHSHFCNFTSTQENPDLTKFWELDSISTKYTLSTEERLCEQSFNTNTYRNDEGRFVVTIPLKSDPQILGNSSEMAKRRFLALERRFQKDTHYKSMYINFMREYEKLGHMSEDREDADVGNFLPHHGVLRESSSTTKLRAVFDASAKTTTGISFNDIQMVGPTVQDDLLSILLRFRQHRYVVSGDIEKMYRAIELTPKQRSLQRIFFREDPSEPLKTYTLNTITYGTASAPYLATKCLVTLDNLAQNPQVQQAIRRDFYIDDFLSGFSSISEAIEICKEIISILSSAKFNLTKFQSNNLQILQQIATKSKSSNNSLNLGNHKPNISTKTLGICWLCDSDTLSFSINIEHTEIITKRHILSIISKIFDPLGLVAPCIIEAKLIMQQLWITQCEWDEEVSSDIQRSWLGFAQTLPLLNNLKIPRWVSSPNSVVHEIHIFTDASEKAYGACVYLRSLNINHPISVHLLTSKSRVAPIKPTTTPRLELCGALMGARLSIKVKESITISINKYYFWSDSTIVLGWLNTPVSQLKKFVSNRVNEIQESTTGCTWRYVPSKDNPADLLSRGVKADRISDSKLWWAGPDYLMSDLTSWPKSPNSVPKQSLPETISFSSTNNNTLFNFNCTESQDYYSIIKNLISKYSNLNTLKRTVAYIQRFIFNVKNKNNKLKGFLTCSELQKSLNLILQTAQMEMFRSEYFILKTGKTLSRNNRLKSLSPFFDSDDNLIRVGGRLSNSNYDYNTKHPIILCSKHPITKTIFRWQHEKILHAGPQLLLASIRQNYWPLGGKNLAKATVNKCIHCFRQKATSVQPMMGQLPTNRTQLEFPFLNCAVDYCGPLLIADRKGRGCKHIKSYLCIFVCLATKAVHLELVTSLTKEAYIAALNRFVARRGKPRSILSDNGTNFVGAANELSKILQDEIASEISQEGIEFTFTPAYSPHFNGLAEAAVRSTKHHLKRLLKLTYLTYEEMATLLTQIENILNSRPLTPISNDPSDLTALTPSHFLIGRSPLSVPYPQISDVPITRLERYKRVELLKQHFWTRFNHEYVLLLQQKTKWSTASGDLQQGALVLVKDKAMPPLLWLLGRVEKVYPGSDGIVRVVDVKTRKGTLRRAFNNICPLPIEVLQPGQDV